MYQKGWAVAQTGGWASGPSGNAGGRLSAACRAIDGRAVDGRHAGGIRGIRGIRGIPFLRGAVRQHFGLIGLLLCDGSIGLGFPLAIGNIFRRVKVGAAAVACRRLAAWGNAQLRQQFPAFHWFT